MNRWEVINYLIERNNYKSYLELGVYKFWCFDKVKCDYKEAVDPNPCKEPWMEKGDYGARFYTDEEHKETEIINKLTTEDYFHHSNYHYNHEDGSFRKFDLIFIDALHKYKNLYDDIQDSLEHLNKGGIILLHDMLPPSYKHTTTGDEHGNWNGDCYKALLQFIQNDFLGHYLIYTVDTDWGIGIIKPCEGICLERSYSLDYNKAIKDWDYFDKNRNELMKVISVEKFKAFFYHGTKKFGL